MPSELIITLPGGKSRHHPLTKDSVTLGRSGVNELHFEDEGLSRKHLLFERTSDGWTVTDCLSKNGTYVNGKRVLESQRLRTGDRISAGHLVVEFRDSNDRELPTPIEFEHKAKAESH